MEVCSHNEAETLEIGRLIGQRLVPPVIVLLEGDLGSGKTVLARGISQGLEIEDPLSVHSPTFTLVNEYRSRTGRIYHIDLYRLETDREIESIGIEEILSSNAIVLIEWAEKLHLHTADAQHVRLRSTQDPDQRMIDIDPPLAGLAPFRCDDENKRFSND